MKIRSLHHVSFIVTDIEKTHEFAKDFGLRTVEKCDDRFIMQTGGGDAWCYKAVKGERGFSGLGFLVESESDLEEAIDKHGATAIRKLDTPGGGVGVTLTSPEGIKVDLVHGIEGDTPVEVHPELRLNTPASRTRFAAPQETRPLGPASLYRLGHLGLFVKNIAALSCAGSCLLSVFTAKAEPDAADINWVSLEAACYQMGETRVYPEEQPIVEACIDAFDIGATEITNQQFEAFVTETGYVTRAERGWDKSEPDGPGIDLEPTSAVFSPTGDPRRPLSWWKLVAGANWRTPEGPGSNIHGRADHPVVHLTRADAEAFAEWAGARLPTEAEWEYAARGGLEGQLMAWADAERAALKDRANTWQGIFPVANTEADGHAGTAPVGSYAANGFGLYDMVGNVWEWTATPYAQSHRETDRARITPEGYDPSQPGIPVGTIKGGSYLCASSYCFRFRPAARQAQDLIFGTSHIGFRIVREAQTTPELLD